MGKVRIINKFAFCQASLSELINFYFSWNHQKTWFSGHFLEEFKLISSLKLAKYYTAWKVSNYGVFSGPYFPVFGLNTEISVNLCIQCEYRNIRTRKYSLFGHFSRSVRSKIRRWSSLTINKMSPRLSLELVCPWAVHLGLTFTHFAEGIILSCQFCKLGYGKYKLIMVMMIIIIIIIIIVWVLLFCCDWPCTNQLILMTELICITNDVSVCSKC